MAILKSDNLVNHSFNPDPDHHPYFLSPITNFQKIFKKKESFIDISMVNIESCVLKAKVFSNVLVEILSLEFVFEIQVIQGIFAKQL